MSETQQQVIQNAEEHRKEIVMCAYGPSGYNESIHNWATEVTGIDCISEKDVIEENYELSIRWDEKGIRKTEALIYNRYIEHNESRNREIINKLRKIDGVEVEHIRDERKEKVNKLNSVEIKFAKMLFSELPEEISGGYKLQSSHSDELPHPSYYKVTEDEDGEEQYGEKAIGTRHESFDFRRVLKKEADREPGSMYETIGKAPSYQFQINLEAPNEETMDAWTEEVIVQLHKNLNKKDGVKKVRYTSCEVTTTKEGECFV